MHPLLILFDTLCIVFGVFTLATGIVSWRDRKRQRTKRVPEP